MSRNDLALGPKIQVKVGDTVTYRNGSSGKVLVVDARSPSGQESTYPLFTQDLATNAVFSHRVDGSLGMPGGSPFDIAVETPDIVVHVRAYRDLSGTIRIVASRDEWPSTPLPSIGETKCVIKAAA